MSRLSYAYSCADPLHAESNPHAVSESESLLCCVLEAAELTAVVDVGRRCICWWLDRETFPWRSGVVGWLAVWCSRNELKSWARRLLLFFIGAYFGGGIIFWSNCTLSADPQLLCIFSWLLLALLVATPRNWLNASVVRFTRTFSEPIRRKPRSFSACSTNHRVTTLQSSSLARPLRTFLPFLSLSFSLFWRTCRKDIFFSKINKSY